MSPRRRLGLFLLALLPFLNGLPYDFTYDDKLIIRDNSRLEAPSKTGEIFTTQYFGGALTSAQNYRPILLLTYAVQEWIHGNRPWLFRAVNLALHAAVTVSVASWLFGLGFAAGPASAVAALFAVATIHVEAVTSLVGRAELLASLLVFVVACLWLRATREGGVARRPYAASLVLFLLAVFVKENAIVAPGVIVLGELFRGGRGRTPWEAWSGLSRAARWALAGFAFPIAVLFAVRLVVIKGLLMSKEAGVFELENPLVVLSSALRAANALGIDLRYVWKTFLPVHLVADHSAYALPVARTLRDPGVWVGTVAVLAGAALALVLWRRRPLAALGLCLFAGAIFPASNVPFVIGTIFAERLAYLPSAGLFCLAVGLLAAPARVVPRPVRPWREWLLLAAVVAYGAATIARNRVWRDDRTLYADMVAKNPNSAKAHYNVAWDAQREGRDAEAAGHLREAVAIFPSYYDGWALLGKLLWDERKWDEAIASYRKSVEIFPSYENGRWGLAKTLEESGRIEDARKAFEDGTDQLPDSYPLAFHRAAFLEVHGALDDAEAAWSDAVDNGDGTAAARLGHARVLRNLGREEEGRDEARFALVRDPANGEARRFLAEGYERAGRTIAGGAEWTRAARANPADPVLLSELLEYADRHPETRFRARLLAKAARRNIPKPDGRLARALAALGS